MERLNFETLFRIVRWDYNRCFKDESLDKDLFMGKYGKVMGEHYYNKFIHEFDGNILKMIGYFRGSEKEGQVFCDMITERIEKYKKARRMWQVVSLLHRGGQFRHGLVEDVDGNKWSINRYENDILTAGCHRIAYSEMESIAKQLGWA